ncbi:hypothetical protein BDZ88DRAFT_442277, partial [Geranomyces variabilis]
NTREYQVEWEGDWRDTWEPERLLDQTEAFEKWIRDNPKDRPGLRPEKEEAWAPLRGNYSVRGTPPRGRPFFSPARGINSVNQGKSGTRHQFRDQGSNYKTFYASSRRPAARNRECEMHIDFNENHRRDT